MTHIRTLTFSLFAFLLGAVLLLSAGCGKEETVSVQTPAGQTVTASLDGGDDFSIREVSGTLSVYQKKKLMLRIAFITAAQRAQRIDHVKLMGGGQDYKEEGDTVSFTQAGQQGLIYTRIVPVGEDTYAFGSTYLPEEAADAVWKRVHMEMKK